MRTVAQVTAAGLPAASLHSDAKSSPTIMDHLKAETVVLHVAAHGGQTNPCNLP